MDQREVALLRLAAQHVAGPGLASPLAVVERLGAVQAQDPGGALTSVALRTSGGTVAGVQAAQDAGEIVRSWPMRGTLHLVPAVDLPWMLRLMTPRSRAAAEKRRPQLGLDASHVARARDLTVGLLSGRRVSRAELVAHWAANGLPTSGGPAYHLLAALAQDGVVCFGPSGEKEGMLVLVEDWVPTPRELDDDEAAGEIALRYFRGHGPATLADLRRWADLPAAVARAGIALAREHLAAVRVDDVEHLMDPGTPALLAACRRQAAALHLLPGFDEMVLGYGDRSATVPPEHADRIVPGGNGVFRPTAILDGRVVATWRWAGTGRNRRAEAELFPGTSSERVRADIAARAGSLP